MALTSTTGTVDGSNVTFENTAQGSSKGEGIIAYVNYTKGAGDSDIVLTPWFNDEDVDANFYQQIYVDGDGLLQALTIQFSATGKFRVPLAAARNESAVRLSVSGLVDGDLNIDFRIDNPFM